MVVGGFALAAADHTVSFWATRTGVRQGDAVQRSDFMVVNAKVPERTARSLIRTSDPLPSRISRLEWSASLPAGSLISSRAVVTRHRVVEVPVTVASGGVPANLRHGDVVDVWASTGDRDTGSTKAVKVLSRVRVVSRSGSGAYDGGPATTVVVDAAGATIDGKLIAAVSTGRVTLVRVT